MKKCKFIYLAMLGVFAVSTAQALPYDQKYWNQKLQIEPFRLPLPPVGYQVEYIDLNGDGKPDAIKSVTVNDTPILWLDDDGNMKKGDIEGDMINDCLLIDRNKDGIYGGQGDLIIDWVDTDDDGKADMQIVIEYPKKNTGEVWPNGHYMIMRDLDKDNIFNYINWNDFSLRCWDKNGVCDFYEDYSGQTMFMKIHTSTYDIKDLRLNWENPFLFYDEDGDGLTEMAIRFVDSPKIKDRSKPSNSYVNRQLEGRIDWVSMAVDLDNDNGPGNEFDFDFTIGFQGKGFDYTDQVHKVNNLRGMPEADKVVFQAHEWMTGMAALYLQTAVPEIATIFTTHATSIGRSIAGNNKPLYDYLFAYNGDQMAQELNMESKHSIEKQTAHYVDCFTTVSEITNNECKELLDKPADVILMNGFEDDFVPKGATFTGKRKRARAVMLRVANSLLGQEFDDDTLIIGTSGRYEFKNKGIDVFLESLNRLNRDKNLKKKVLAFVNVPSWVGDPREDLQRRLKKKDEHYTTPLEVPFITHWLLHNILHCLLWQ